MEYSFIADTYEQIEATTKRLEMTDYLMDLIQNTPKDLIRKVAYLTRGTLKPDFMGIEIGIAEKLAIESIARVTGVQRKRLLKT